ncbi:BatA domain-containing protein [Candidatus Woesearchaeota archaeon]|nr:BatA domain-containing protein [Candidatus Woesearchaeota archaeon]
MAFFEVITGFVAEHLLYALGLWALLSLIPLIIVYLIRPKPKKQQIPALMFLMKERAKSDKRSFFRRIIKDPLLLLQILLLIIFAITIAKPFITATEDVLVEKTAIVIDASASSQAGDDETRFERAIEYAKDNLATKNTIIIIGSVPELVAENVEPSKAKEELSRIKPRDTPTNIFDALIFSGNHVKEGDKILVISDFIETSAKNHEAAKSILESRGVLVEFKDLKKEETELRNVGIIDLDVKEDETTVQIKNYNDQNETVSLKLEGTELSIPEIMIESRSVESISFPTPVALSKFSIMPREDNFALDNDIYISAPSKEAVPLLLITNSNSKYLRTALEVIDTVDAETGEPPKVPEIAHQIIIIDNVNSDLILPGTMNNIRKQVENGATLIIMAQPDLTSMDFEGMLPVERVDDSGPIMIDHKVPVMATQDNTITEDVVFGTTDKYLLIKPVDGSVTLASTSNNVSMVVMKNHKKGTVIYFGFMDQYSTFKEDIYYPVFWKRLFDMAVKKQDISELNFKTGRLVHLLKEQKIQAPYGKINTDTILLSHQGIYRGEEKNFVANLLSEAESDINGRGMENKMGVYADGETQKDKVPFELTKYFIIGLMVLVFIELLWIKFRGDL